MLSLPIQVERGRDARVERFDVLAERALALDVENCDAAVGGSADQGGIVGQRVGNVAAERLAADKGAGLGRLNLSVATDRVTLAEDAAHPFGFKLSTLSATGTGMTLTQPTGADPDSLEIQVATQPLEGDTVTINLTLPDGTETSLKLTAVTGTPAAGEYQIGATVDLTAANLSAALQTKLTEMANTELTVASNYAAADNFFNEQGDPVLDQHGRDLLRCGSIAWAGYLGTTGVYGDRGGDWVSEADPAAPTMPRTRRRARAEAHWLASGLPAHLFRLAGIYGPGPGRSALAAVRAGTARHLGDGGDVDQLRRRVGRTFQEEGAGVGADGTPPGVEVGAVDKGGVDAESRQEGGDDVVARTEQGTGGNHMVAGIEIAAAGLLKGPM